MFVSCMYAVYALGMSSNKSSSRFACSLPTCYDNKDGQYVFNNKESIKDLLNRVGFKCLANNICDNMEWKKVLYYTS